MVEVGRDFLPTFSSAEKVGRVRLRRIRNRRSFDFAQDDSVFLHGMTEQNARSLHCGRDDSNVTTCGDRRNEVRGGERLLLLGGYVYFGTVEGQGYLVIFTAE